MGYILNDIRYISITFFGIVVFIAFLIYAVFEENEANASYREFLQKVIWGLSVFIIALVADSNFVYVVSLFIGGLIIATEKFMQLLAVILKTDSESMAETFPIDLNARGKRKKIQEMKRIASEIPSENLDKIMENLNYMKKDISISDFDLICSLVDVNSETKEHLLTLVSDENREEIKRRGLLIEK